MQEPYLLLAPAKLFRGPDEKSPFPSVYPKLFGPPDDLPVTGLKNAGCSYISLLSSQMHTHINIYIVSFFVKAIHKVTTSLYLHIPLILPSGIAGVPLLLVITTGCLPVASLLHLLLGQVGKTWISI